jgi:tetratricopeptide (TPR) repeat protein
LRELVASVAKYDAERGVDDFLKLLNTNFDGADVYWGLGCLFMELWQLETASMWFQKMIKQPGISQSAQARGYLELADAMIWRNDDLVKALEYAKLALDLGERDERAFMVLAHGYLRSGQMRAAQTYLESADKGGDPEGVYLLGLLHYRNGDRATANKIWKPLLIVRSESLRFHHIKQEILKYYYEAQPYLKTHVN